MKKSSLILFMVIAFTMSSVNFGCKKDKNDADEIETLKGNPGNPRFNLQFTNEDNVDLDLYVTTPAGNTIYYGDEEFDGGKLDLDCLCDECINGPNENIFWLDGTAPKGTYKFWVEHYDNCIEEDETSTSDFTLRLIKNDVILQKYTGTLSRSNNKSTVYTHTQE